MMIKVVPNLLNIFDDKSALPETTKLLISISDAFRDYWAVFIIVFFIFFIFVSVWKKTPDGKYLFDKMLLYIPIF
ncbi:hypothetical protein HOG21_05145 [bacterium]|nr:hypothetical protein [bacterium]